MVQALTLDPDNVELQDHYARFQRESAATRIQRTASFSAESKASEELITPRIKASLEQFLLNLFAAKEDEGEEAGDGSRAQGVLGSPINGSEMLDMEEVETLLRRSTGRLAFCGLLNQQRAKVR